jgi:arylsulfatase
MKTKSMRNKTILTTLSFLLSALFTTSALAAKVPDNLPQPDPVFKGKIGETYHDSTPDPGLFASPTAPKGAPNVLLILIDDAGFGASSTFR